MLFINGILMNKARNPYHYLQFYK